MSPTFRFIPAMYRAAVVDKIKTQTRRVIVPQPGSDINPVMLDERSGVDFCFQWHSKESRREPTYGPPGTVLPVVTTWAVWGGFDTICPVDLNKELIVGGSAPKARYHGIWWNDGSPKPEWAGKSRPAMFFPKHLYPLARQARVVAVKAERVQDISEADAIAEGIQGVGEAGAENFGRFCFAKLWDSINAERGKGALKGCYAWARNPWVFATTFEVLPDE